MLVLLPRIDADLAAQARAAGCAFCGGRLDVADYPRKPRGADGLDETFAWRHSFCCAVEGCRRRRTPPSVRFLGRKVYLGAVVILATALQQGPSKLAVRKLATLIGIDRRTLVRWRRWWTTMFVTSRFWTSLRGRLASAIDEAALPTSLMARLTATADNAVLALLRLLAPVSTQPHLDASAS